jgi:hypothetical protein
MRGRSISATATILAALAAIGTSGVSTASAQVTARGASFRAAPRAAAPDFTCQDGYVCAYPNDDWTGDYPSWGGPAQFATYVFRGSWLSFAAENTGNPNPGSINNDSGSTVWIYEKNEPLSSTNPFCIPTYSRLATYNDYGWFFIRYGVTSCGSYPTPLP